MGNLTFKVGPSFIFLAAICIAFRQSYLLAMYAISVLIHELAHFCVARHLGYECCQIKLSVFGAVLYGNFDCVSSADELKIAAAGPVINLVLTVVLVAFWWILPPSYYFTEPAVSSNLSLALVNLLPCYPLDGGRVLIALFTKKLEHKKAVKITQTSAFIVAGACFCLFGLSLIMKQPNFSLGAFSAFVFGSAVTVSDEMLYRRLFMVNRYVEKLKRGIEVKSFAVASDMQLLQLLKKLNANYYATFTVFDGERKIATIEQNQLEHIISSNSSDTLLRDLKI